MMNEKKIGQNSKDMKIFQFRSDEHQSNTNQVEYKLQLKNLEIFRLIENYTRSIEILENWIF